MMMVKPIRTEGDYEANLERIETLIDALPGTPEGDELEILSTLIERYENERFPIAAPTPLAAIRFRMEQGGMTPRDLEPFIGSRSRVSEVLSGTRPLSIDMIRALNEHLGIPAEVLIRSEPQRREKIKIELSRPAAKQLSAWRLLQAGEPFEAFMARAAGGAPTLARLRKTRTDRTNAKTDPVAVQAWCGAVLLRSQECKVEGKFSAEAFNLDLVRSLAKLSVYDDGPIRARDALSKLGIVLVILPHLPGTHLDGAAMRRADGVPVIALTLRRDRTDSFWFTLLHELAHVVFHLKDEKSFIFDDLEIGSSEAIEEHADRLAQEALVPKDLWAEFKNSTYTSLADIVTFARRAEVNPAIIAGRWQKQNRDFRKFSRLLGHGSIRSQFAEFTPASSDGHS
jgi:HTH-type transcriptional regulator/antitoxin HigA